MISKCKEDLIIELKKMQGKTKANFLPFLHKEKIDFGCSTKVVLYNKGTIPMKLFKDNTSILKAFKKEAIKKTLAPLREFNVFGLTFIDHFEVINSSELVITYELVEKNQEIDALTIEFLHSAALYAFSFFKVAKKIRLVIINSQSAAETFIDYDFKVSEDQDYVILNFKDPEDGKIIEHKVDLVHLKLEFERIKNAKISPKENMHCVNCDFKENCF